MTELRYGNRTEKRCAACGLPIASDDKAFLPYADNGDVVHDDRPDPDGCAARYWDPPDALGDWA